MPINYNFDSITRGVETLKEEAKKQEELIGGYARTASRAYQFYSANPVAHLEGHKKEIDLPFQPTDPGLPPEVREKAELARISEIWNDSQLKGENGLLKAQERLGITRPSLKILPEYSSSEFVTVEYPDGSLKVAFRGTKPEGVVKSGKYAGKIEPNYWKDIIFRGTEGNLAQFQDAEKLLNKLIASGRNVNELIGYSMGGTKALHFGDKLRIKTTTFNPLLGVRALFGVKQSPTTQHYIWNTTGDVATTGLGLTKPSNFNVRTVEPLKSAKLKNEELLLQKKPIAEIKDLLNPVKGHALNNFTDVGDRESLAPIETRKIALPSDEAIILDQAVKTIRRGGTYAEFIHSVNSGRGQDTIVVNDKVKLHGKRAGQGSNFLRIWNQEGGLLTPEESAYVSETKSQTRPFESRLTDSQKIKIRNGELAQVTADIQDPQTMERIAKLANLSGEDVKYRRVILNTLMKGAGMAGTGFSLGANLLAGEMASQINLDELNPEVRSLIVGGISGGGGEALIQGAKAGVSGVAKASLAANQLILGEKTVADIASTVASRASPHIAEMARIAATIRRSTIAGGLGALAQEITADGLNSALLSAGVNPADAFVASQTVGGGVGGAVTVGSLPAIETALTSASTALSSLAGLETATISAEASTALLSGEIGAEALLTEVATTAGARALAAEAGAELGAAAGSIIPGFGTLIGAGIGAAIAGTVAFFINQSHHQPRTIFLLKPFRNQDIDRAIAEDPEVVSLVNEMNDFAEKLTWGQVREYTARIQELVDSRGLMDGNYGFNVDFMMVPESVPRETGGDTESVMVQADYSNIPPELATAKIRDIPGTPQYEQHQLDLDATRRQNVELYRQGLREDIELDRSYQYYFLDDLQDELDHREAAGKPVANYYQLNQVIRTMIEENPRRNSMIYRGVTPVPYFDKDGNMSFRDDWREKIDINEFIDPPETDIVFDTINKDQKIQELMDSGDIHGVNKRIREIFKSGETASFKDVTQYGDRTMPQFTEAGEMVFQNLKEAPPTQQTEAAKQQAVKQVTKVTETQQSQTPVVSQE